MKTFLFSILIFFGVYSNAQTYSQNFNVDIENKDVKNIVDLWQSYLKTNSRDDWDKSEVKDLKNFNILDIDGVINPSLMNWHFNNRILSVNPISENTYLIKSMFQTDANEVFAITNVLAKKIGSQFKLSNYIFEYTKDWKTDQELNIKYIHRAEYNLNKNEINETEEFYSQLCQIFDVKPEKLTYFIAKDCDNIFDILGFEYIFQKGGQKECGYFESKNNFIFATEKAGANHYHEITHFINDFYPNANQLLLVGISAYLGKDKAHFGKPLIFHTKRVDAYLKENIGINLSKPFDFYKLDEKTNPQYVIGAVICELILEKGGKKELINAFRNTKTDEDLIKYLKTNILRENENLNTVLRNKISEISKLDEFPDFFKNSIQ
ncbi:hypothetical protein [Halpernia sp.]|uniref:hypothetical protein n=1 Tax=Halpernia sp. TaxID=2782209 RepID=UPI003A8E458E